METINELIATLKDNSAQEALFVYAKLCTDNAFDYVATELPRGVEVKFVRQQYVGLVLPYDTDEGSITEHLDTILGNDIQQLADIDEAYKQAFDKFKGLIK